MEKAKENWSGELCSEIQQNLEKRTVKRAYQLVNVLTTDKQGKATAVQDLSGKCPTEEQQMLNHAALSCTVTRPMES